MHAIEKHPAGVSLEGLPALENLFLETSQKYKTLISVGQKLASASDRDSLLRCALSCLQKELSFDGARIELEGSARQAGRRLPGRLFALDPPAQLVIPVGPENEPLGKIVLPLRGAREICDLDREVLQTFAAFLAVGIRNVQRVEEFRALASVDALTGLLNRRRLFEIGRQRRRTTRATGLIVFDVDWLKRINDTFGHLAGDALLKGIAQRANACIRKTDFLVRYGGDEFVILLPNTGLTSVRKVAERVRAYVERTSVEWQNQAIGSTISVGAACIEGDVDIHNLLTSADEALLEAKRAGRNAVRIAASAVPPVAVGAERLPG